MKQTTNKDDERQVMTQAHLTQKSDPSAKLKLYKVWNIFRVMFKMVILILPFTGDQMIKLSMML